MATRVCGDCTLCCTELGIAELEKAPNTKCPHECGKCGIYDTRPTECRTFECLWLAEGRRPKTRGPLLFWESDKPTRSGVLFYPAQGAVADDLPVIVARGDFERGKATIERLAKRIVVILAHADGRRQIAGPESYVRSAVVKGLQLVEDDERLYTLGGER